MIFTLLALSGAIVASYTDLKWGIIPNKLNFSLFGLGVIGHLFLEKLSVIKPLFISISLMFLIGFSLWRVIPVLSAADVKMFIALGALLPSYPIWLMNRFTPTLNQNYPFVITIFFNTIL
jgi:preflagellin peptidase FlaK